jgi:hypothetical protein
MLPEIELADTASLPEGALKTLPTPNDGPRYSQRGSKVRSMPLRLTAALSQGRMPALASLTAYVDWASLTLPQASQLLQNEFCKAKSVGFLEALRHGSEAVLSYFN